MNLVVGGIFINVFVAEMCNKYPSPLTSRNWFHPCHQLAIKMFINIKEHVLLSPIPINNVYSPTYKSSRRDMSIYSKVGVNQI